MEPTPEQIRTIVVTAQNFGAMYHDAIVHVMRADAILSGNTHERAKDFQRLSAKWYGIAYTFMSKL